MSKTRMSTKDVLKLVLTQYQPKPDAPRIDTENYHDEVMWLGKCKHNTWLGLHVPTAELGGHVTSSFLEPLAFPFNEPCSRYIYKTEFGIPYDEYPEDPELDLKLREGRLRPEHIERMKKAETEY